MSQSLSTPRVVLSSPHLQPGYEHEQGTPAGERNQRIAPNGGYERLRVATVKWAMVDQLKNPPAGFEDAVAAHFKLKRAHVRRVVKGWLKEARASDTVGHYDALKTEVRLVSCVSCLVCLVARSLHCVLYGCTRTQVDKLEAELKKLGPSPSDAYEGDDDKAKEKGDGDGKTTESASQGESSELTDDVGHCSRVGVSVTLA